MTPAARWAAGLAIAGILFLALLSRWDGAETERLKAEDAKDQVALDQTIKALRSYQAQVKASAASKAEVARLRQQMARDSVSQVRLAHLADSVTRSLRPILAALPDSQATPIRVALQAKDSVIVACGLQVSTCKVIADSLERDAGRWETEAGNQRSLARTWQARAVSWEKVAKKGCLPLIGCASRTTAFLAGAGVTAGLVVALR